MIENLGFRTHYHFKQTQIEANVGSKDAVEREIRTKIIPAIQKLEAELLINGFYFIIHSKIDLRLSSDFWDEKEDKIRLILRENGIKGELTHYKNPRKDDFKNLDDNNLEFNSRFMMAYLLIKEELTEEARIDLDKIVPSRWIHYMYNQFGYINIYQATIEFNSAFFQLTEARKNQQCTSDDCLRILRNVKEISERYIDELEKGGK